ncbi:LamG-like jellyroll fold domain-containing protein [Streptomyces sp. NPDC002044]|uniref:LamG-like jellyroll fold domain-containing protein n=1 Tax=Streptomyces sp. NPDC002044 TaxID=3154662 RepID=UPI003325E833
MTDGTNPPSSPQPEQPAPGSGGYGFPPGPPASGGYGYPADQDPRPSTGDGYGHPPPPASGGGYGYGYPADQGQGQGHPNPYQQDLPGPYRPGSYQQFPGGAPGAPADQGGAGGPADQGGAWPPAGARPAPFERQRSGQPDWDALADRSAAERRKKRLWTIGGVAAVLLLLAGGGTFLLLGGEDKAADVADKAPAATGSASPKPEGSKSKAPVDKSPTVASDPTLIRDHGGKDHLKMSAEAGVFAIDKHYELRTKGNEKSYAEAEKRVVDASKSFSVSARVWNRSPKGRQIAVSQGNEKTFGFELGSDEVNGKPAWIFRVQTSDQGADSTTQTIAAEGLKMAKTMTTLTGTYDAEKKTITLYVNGKKTSEGQVTGVYNAPGPLQLARSRHEGNWSGSWNGAMDSMRAFAVALSPEQVAAVRQNKLSPSVKPSGAWVLL